MKLSHEKLVHLSHVIVGALSDEDGVTLQQGQNEVRLKILELLKESMKLQEQIDQAVRRKIQSQRRSIVEGSREWDVLYRKYYEEEAGKYRKVR